jgi:hypothetical protein
MLISVRAIALFRAATARSQSRFDQFKVFQKAKDFDNDSSDDDNQVELN